MFIFSVEMFNYYRVKKNVRGFFMPYPTVRFVNLPIVVTSSSWYEDLFLLPIKKKISFFILSLIHMIEEALTIYKYGWERGVEKENINFYILIKKVISIRINEKRYH